MKPARARMPLFVLLAVCVAVLQRQSALDLTARAASRRPPTKEVVYLGGGLTLEQAAVLSATVAAADPSSVLLLDTPHTSTANRNFVTAFGPSRIVPIGRFDDDLKALQERLGCRREPAQSWDGDRPGELWSEIFPTAQTVVICPPGPRPLLLQATCLAGAARAPLCIFRNGDGESKSLVKDLKRWGTRRVYVLGNLDPSLVASASVESIKLADEGQVASEHIRLLVRTGPVRSVVVTNPADGTSDCAGLSSLAPWVAIQKRAVLLFTGPKGDDAEAIVERAVRAEPLRSVDTLILVADLKSIPPQRRKNPVAGDKDEYIEAEPLTPSGREAYSFSIGRLFHRDPAMLALLLARQRLLARHDGPPHALVASNPGGGLPLLEMFSRQTIRELRNCGFETTAMLGKSLEQDALRREMPKHDLFLWEGHHNTLINDWKFPEWDEPLPPSLVILQSCLALKEGKVQPLLDRGAVGVIGTSSRTYSASGGAYSLAFINAMLYDDLPAGDALRQAKNFMVVYSLLKDKRLGKEAKRTGANLRAAWAFTLWGDPTLRLPRDGGEPKAPPIRTHVEKNRIVVTFPEKKYDPMATEKYQFETYPNARLAGLVHREREDDPSTLVPLVFAEVSLTPPAEGKQPQLKSKLPSRNWVFNWDARRNRGYLLALPRDKDGQELRFSVQWVNEATENED